MAATSSRNASAKHPLQNRVTPFGEIVALPGRGVMLGNRGILHDEARHIVRSSQVRRWIACLLEFRGRRRHVMRPHSYTELFFLDEATAFSAGHRPCAECRHADYRRFRDLWERCVGAPASADSIDKRLHAERRAGRSKRTYFTDISELPNGTYVVKDGSAWLVWGTQLLKWSDSGYSERRRRTHRSTIEVLTPPAIVAVLEAGYEPSLHWSAG